MSERYMLAPLRFGTVAAIELSKAEYDVIVQAVARLLSCLDAEEKFDCIIENYRDLENFMLNEAFESLFGKSLDSLNFQAWRLATSRKLSNLLSSVRLYQDSIGRHARIIVGDESAAQKIKADKSRQFDSSLSYRTLDALRNHAQHYALPIHGNSVARRTTEDREFFEHEFKAYIIVSELSTNLKFEPKKTLDELKRGPNKVELKRVVREYIECLSALHNDFRLLTNETVSQQLAALTDGRAKLIAKFPDEDSVGLAVFLADEEGFKIGEETGLSSLTEKHINALRAKNNHLTNFARRRVSY